MKSPTVEHKLYMSCAIAAAMLASVKDCIDNTIFEDYSNEGVDLMTGLKLVVRLAEEVEKQMLCAFRDSQKSQCT